ncbi:MAG: hypothetical protein HY661_01170 [Betaproteobacteria bacterium]|nr:hypothetical protein [Betaproteobacteria bacterium]
MVERLPLKAGDPISRELRELRQALVSDPGNPEAAARLARRYFDLAMAEGDPRYVGYAEAAIRRWIAAIAPPIEILFTRALLRQYRHDFTGALADIDAVLARDPGYSNALMWRVALNLAQANYGAARADCERARSVVSALSAIACPAVVDGLTGKARSAYATLSAAMAQSPTSDPDQKQWMLTRLAEMAQRFGDGKRAERHFREALAASGPDQFVLAAYADFLLDEKRPAEVIALLKDWSRSDSLLLRLARAESMLGTRAAAEHTKALADRFAAAALRGDKLHQKDEALFELHLRNSPARAVELAKENWTAQREPSDARVLLEAAIAANRPEAARPALEWLQATGYEDPRYRALGEALGRPGK